MPQLFEINRTPVGSYLNPLATPGRNYAFGAAQGVQNRHQFRSNQPNRATAATTQVDRYNPNQEGLDKDGLLDDITPKSDEAIARLFDRIYQSDAVSGSAIDMLRTFAWSDWTLSGIKDPEVMKLFTDALEMFNPVVTMPEIHGEALKQGRSISSLVFSEDRGTWVDIIPHTAQSCLLTPVPIRGFDPLVDVITTPEMRAFVESRDERMREPQKRIPDRLLKAFKSGKTQLDPLTTLFVPRRVSMTDWKGTSLYWRILPYFAIEKALLQSTITNARRRTRSILHAQVGIDNVWEPTDDELMQVTTLFLQTEEDPAGAVLATRNGINVSEVRSGSDHWKISEEQDQLRAAKLNALGMSESILSGEANFNTMDATLTMFVEGQKVSRTHFTNVVIYRMLFAQIARAHGLIKSDTSHADASYGVRTGGRTVHGSPMSTSEALAIPFKDLQMPMIHWTKNLSPQSDQAYMDVLEKAEGKKVPITISMWASAAGIDLQQVIETLPDDKKMRDRLAKFAPKPPEGEGGFGGGGGAFGSTIYSPFMVDDLGIAAMASIVGIGPDQTLFGVKLQKVQDVFDMVTANHRAMEILHDWPALESMIRHEVDTPEQVEAVKYLFARAGYAKCPVDSKFLVKVGEQIAVEAETSGQTKERLKLIRDEMTIIASIYLRSQEMLEAASPEFYKIAQNRIRTDVATVAARKVLKSFTGLGDEAQGRYLYSGITNV